LSKLTFGCPLLETVANRPETIFKLCSEMDLFTLYYFSTPDQNGFFRALENGGKKERKFRLTFVLQLSKSCPHRLEGLFFLSPVQLTWKMMWQGSEISILAVFYGICTVLSYENGGEVRCQKVE